MKKIILLSLLCISGLSMSAQNWKTDIDEAKEIASKENKKIILVFQGSDWCAPCIKLNREIWSTDEFRYYAKDHYVMLKADFPKRKKNALSEDQQTKNNLLAETYNKNGNFPFVVVLNSKGKKLGVTGYKKTNPKNFISLINSF